MFFLNRRRNIWARHDQLNCIMETAIEGACLNLEDVTGFEDVAFGLSEQRFRFKEKLQNIYKQNNLSLSG